MVLVDAMYSRETYLGLAQTVRDAGAGELHSLISADRHRIVRAPEIMAADPDREDYRARLNLLKGLIYASPVVTPASPPSPVPVSSPVSTPSPSRTSS